MSLIEKLTDEERRRFLALDYVGNFYSCETDEEILPAAKGVLKFIETGEYDIEEGEVIDLQSVNGGKE